MRALDVEDGVARALAVALAAYPHISRLSLQELNVSKPAVGEYCAMDSAWGRACVAGRQARRACRHRRHAAHAGRHVRQWRSSIRSSPLTRLLTHTCMHARMPACAARAQHACCLPADSLATALAAAESLRVFALACVRLPHDASWQVLGIGLRHNTSLHTLRQERERPLGKGSVWEG